MLRRRFMKQATGISGYNFQFVANYVKTGNKNVMTISQTNVSSRGIGFCIHTPVFNSSTTNNVTVYFVSQYANADSSLKMTIKTTFPNGDTYSQIVDDILTSGGAGKGLACYIEIVDNTNISGDPLYYIQPLTNDYAEDVSMGANNIGSNGNNYPTTPKVIVVANSLGISGNSVVLKYGNTDLPEGDYTFDITLSGDVPKNENIYISNCGHIDRITDPQNNKNYLNYRSANRSKKTWVSGDNIFIDNMFKENGSV